MELPKVTLLYWIHCNRCFEMYIRKQRKVYLLTCQHMSCEKCIKKVENENDTYICPICKNKVTARLMSNNLPPQIKELFNPQPWLDGLPASHIVRFQQPHRKHFEHGMQRLSREFERLEESSSQARANARKKFEELEEFRYERRQFEKRVRKVNKQRKEIEEKRAQKKAASTISSDHVVTVDSGIAVNATIRRHLIASQAPTIRPRSSLTVNTPRFQNPNNFSFRNFAFRNTADFTL